MLYFGMSYQFDMMSDNLVVYKGTKFTEYEDIEQEVEEEKSNFSILWDKVLGAVPYIASYTGGVLTGFVNSFLPIDFSDYSKQSDTFRAGLLGGDIIGATVGMALIDAGSGGLVVGTTVVCTGVGVLPGVAIDAGSAAAIGLGGWMMLNSTRNAANPNRYKGSSSSGSSGSGSSGGGSSGGGGKKPQKMLGENGSQINSNTILKRGSTERIDVENPAPGKRPGQIHYHEPNNKKWYYDEIRKKFYDQDTKIDAPKKIQDLLKDKEFQKAIDKGLKMLGE